MEHGPKTIDEIVLEQIGYCRRDPEAYVRFLVINNPRRELVMMLYTDAVIKKKIKPLEAQTEEIKRYYWGEAKKENKGHLTAEPLKKLAKALYWLEQNL